MTYKIVETVEKRKPRLCIVPSHWEKCGILKWPKKGAEILVFDENVTPRREWSEMNCKVKRHNFPSYEAADAELLLMLANTDTEHEDEANFRQRPRPSREAVNLNDLAVHLVLPQNLTEVSQEFIIVPDIPENEAPAGSSGTEVTNTLNMLLENQSRMIETTNNILINQSKIMQKLASLSVQVEESISKVDNFLYSDVTTLKQASSAEKESFTLKQIKNAFDLEQMEMLLADDNYRLKLMRSCSIVCSGGIGSGVNCAYRFLDVLFSRDFLCECSWSGSTRKDGIKISLKCYKNTVYFFFKMVHQWDNTYTQDVNESFFKNILKNANKRSCAKNERISTKRIRTKGVKKNKMQEPNTTANVNEIGVVEAVIPLVEIEEEEESLR